MTIHTILTFHNGDVVNNTTYNLVFPSCHMSNLPKTERRRRRSMSPSKTIEKNIVQNYWISIRFTMLDLRPIYSSRQAYVLLAVECQTFQIILLVDSSYQKGSQTQWWVKTSLVQEKPHMGKATPQYYLIHDSNMLQSYYFVLLNNC